MARRPQPDGASAGRVCIVTGEIAGPDYNGGIGTANRGLALALQRAGFAVDVLYTRVEAGQPFSFRRSFEEQVSAFRALGIDLMCIAHQGRWNDWLGKSLRVMEVLQAGAYDIAFFDDTHGTAYYTALAKRSGSAELARTALVVVTHSATQWIADLNQSPIQTLADVTLLEIERRSIELADYVVSPSAYILRKYQSYGWQLPEKTLVRPNILPFSSERTAPSREHRHIDEIVFFGRLERRKGLWMFCEALDRLKYQIAGTKVTFLGKFTHEDGESTGFTLLRRSSAWPFAPTLLYNYDRDQALSYLKGGNRLAVMPSREDNSPCVIFECLVEGIPFIASAGSGGQELIATADHAGCLFQPTAEHLAEKLRRVLAEGATTAQPSFMPQENIRQTVQWVAGLVAEARREPERPEGAEKPARGSAKDPDCTLLLLAPDGMPPELIADTGCETALRHPDARVVVLADVLGEVTAALERQGSAVPANLSFGNMTAFAKHTAAAGRGAGFLALCRLDQPVPAAVLARARSAFRATGIDAFTVMRGHAVEIARPEQPFVCTTRSHWMPERFKTGNAQALLALAQDSNAGLLLLRQDRADILTRIAPRDPQLCRLKDIELYIHEVLLALTAAGARFELLPDCYVPAAAMLGTSETFALPGLGLRHVTGTKGYAAGSENALLSRLTIEMFARDAARVNALRQLSGFAARLGDAILDDKSYWPASRAFTTFSRVAQAAGRPALALSLVTRSIGADVSPQSGAAPSPADIVTALAQTVSLAGLLAGGAYDRMNLNHEWSLRFDVAKEEIEVHPNGAHEGDATLIFSNVSFPGPALFMADLELWDTARGPVKFEVHLLSETAGAQQFEWVLQPGDRKSISFTLPHAYEAGCDVMLATRMLSRRESTEGAHAKWHRPSFRPL